MGSGLTRDALLVLHIQRQMLTLMEGGFIEAIPGSDTIDVKQGGWDALDEAVASGFKPTDEELSALASVHLGMFGYRVTRKGVDRQNELILEAGPPLAWENL